MKTPNELKYSKTHEWVRFISDTEAEVGLTDYAQDALGDLVFVNLPEIDTAAATLNPSRLYPMSTHRSAEPSPKSMKSFSMLRN